jgi:hypothetical protein
MGSVMMVLDERKRCSSNFIEEDRHDPAQQCGSWPETELLSQRLNPVHETNRIKNRDYPLIVVLIESEDRTTGVF